MKRILLLLLVLPTLVFAQRNAEFVVEIKNGFQYLNHKVKRGETILDLSTAYSVKPQVIENINHLTNGVLLKENQLLMIPLMETNYFKMTGITSEQNGFYPLYYKVTQNESFQSICSKFSVLPAAVKKWNHDNFEDELQENEKIIVGWIKYKSSDFVKSESVNSTSTSNTKISQTTNAESNSTITRTTSSPVVSQTNSSTNSSSNYVKEKTVTSQQSYPEKRNHASKLNQWFAKVRSSFKSNKEQKEAKQQPVKKIEANSSATTSSAKASKKSLKTIWNDLVNGKEKPKTTQEVSAPQPISAKPIASKPTPKNNVLYEKSQQSKGTISSNNNTQVAPKPRNQYNKPVAMETSNTKKDVKINPKKAETVSNQTSSKPTVSAKAEPIRKEVKSESNVVKETVTKPNKVSESTKKVESVVKSKPAIQAEETKSEKSQDAKKENEIVEVKPEEIKPVHSEVRALDLSESRTGKCAYFFSGPTSGRFYVFTNLAVKGEIVKVTNTANNRFVMAEVIGNLPMSDVTKGLIIKLSDNAKLALSQHNNLFTVKVNF